MNCSRNKKGQAKNKNNKQQSNIALFYYMKGEYFN